MENLIENNYENGGGNFGTFGWDDKKTLGNLGTGRIKAGKGV